MTPKEKAKQLYDKMKFETKYNSQPSTVHGMCKKLALVCVDIILNDVGAKDWELDTATNTNYWQDVRNEISLLHPTCSIKKN